MKRLFILCIFATLVSMALAGKDNGLTLDQIFESSAFELKSLGQTKWLPEGDAFVTLRRDTSEAPAGIYKHPVNKADTTLWIALKDIKKPGTDEPLPIFDYDIAPSGETLLIKSDARRVWRRHSLARFYVYHIEDHKTTAVHEGAGRIAHAKLSPDEKHVAYVRDNNIYLKDLQSGETIPVTNDGSETVINGQFDWVYEEEFGIADGWRWSPDSKKIAFWRLDQSPEPTFSWMEFAPKNGQVRTIRYPKAGDPVAKVKIGVYHLNNGQTVWMHTSADTNLYIPRIKWTDNNDILAIQRLNRLQNRLDLLMANVHSGETSTLLSDSDSCWVEVDDDWFFTEKNKSVIYTSEKSGYNHIYRYQIENGKEEALTSGSWVVQRVYGIDEQTQRVFFKANKGDVKESHIFSVNLITGAMTPLTKTTGWHSAKFGPAWNAFINRYSSVKTPPQTVLRNAAGKSVRTLIENTIEPFTEAGLVHKRFLTFTTEDGAELNAEITLPADFDKSRQYPVLIYGYGGPGSQLVRNSWGRSFSRMWYTMLTQKGYIIFTVDNRGTGGRGKAFKNLAYGDIGYYAVNDHIEAAEYLSSLSYVDSDRIGIWGWSGGGYLTLMAMTNGSEHFNCGVAVAPVSDFRLYDAIWTERYMGMPSDNHAGYESASSLNYVDQFDGDLLIIHGSADDNVHMQNTMQFIREMQSHRMQFDLMIYPEKNHSILGTNTRKHLYRLITEFVLNHL